MTGAPLYQSLQNLLAQNPVRFDMPGHHGKPLPFFVPTDWTGLDWTEHKATGDLFCGGDAIEQAEQAWADRWGAEGALFLTGGSTQGVHMALQLCCKPGDTILADRGSHRSLWNGLALLDVHPVFVNRPWDAEREIAGPMDPGEADALWAANPQAKALFVTSPTYYGVNSDIGALARVAHRHGGLLVVDCAHGAHFPWIGLQTPCQQGADLTVISAHKTLPVPGQCALLLYRGISGQQVRQAGAVYGTSSPGYVMMAAMDGVRAWMQEQDRWREPVTDLLPTFRQQLQERTPFRCVENDDHTRLVLDTRYTGYTGHQVLDALEKKGIYIEMADLTHLVLITGCLDWKQDFERLLQALASLPSGDEGPLPRIPAPPELPHRMLSLRQAMFADTCQLPLQACEGRISAEQIAPYPPGVPVILPGEQITKKHLAYLKKIGYNTDQNGIVCK